MSLIRQGDVLLIPTQKVAGKLSNNKVLAEGEVSGHHHVIYDADVYRSSNALYVSAKNGCVLKHDDTNLAAINGEYPQADHHPINVPAGMYEVRIQRAFSYTSAKEVKVID